VSPCNAARIEARFFHTPLENPPAETTFTAERTDYQENSKWPAIAFKMAKNLWKMAKNSFQLHFGYPTLSRI
jgi:hypothetical protein